MKSLNSHNIRSAQSVDVFLTGVGIGLIGYVFIVYATSVALFSLGSTVSSNTVWFALLLSSILVIFLASRQGLSPILSVCCGLSSAVLILAFAGISGLFYDMSWDGIAYHQEAVIQLANGWNPIRTSLGDAVIHSMWIDHYPKFSWIFAANHYVAFGNIETGKCYSLIVAASLALLSFSLLRRHWDVDWWWALVLSCLVVANPVLINQSLSYYVDGLLYVSFVLTCVAASHAISGRNNIWYLVFGIAGILLVNTKLTGAPYFCLIAAAVAVYLFIHRSFRDVVHFVAISAAIFLIAVLLFGYDTYVKNTLEHGHPLYPIYGPGAIDIITSQSPVYFENRGLFTKFFASLFHVVSNSRDSALQLRLPFLLQSRTELYESVGHDVRLSGFGFWFSGVFVLAFAALAYAGVSKAARFSKSAGFFAVFALLVTVLVNPEAWWARYVPQLWLVPVLAIVLLRFVPTAQANILSWLMVAVMFVNSGLILRGMALSHYRATSEMRMQYSSLHAGAGPLSVQFGLFHALRARLDYHDISYSTVPENEPLPCSVSHPLPGAHTGARYCSGN